MLFYSLTSRPLCYSIFFYFSLPHPLHMIAPLFISFSFLSVVFAIDVVDSLEVEVMLAEEGIAIHHVECSLKERQDIDS